MRPDLSATHPGPFDWTAPAEPQSRGGDFRYGGLRYQIKACQPSGKRGSKITKVPPARNYQWDRLIWILYDSEFHVLEAREWDVQEYQTEFQAVLDRLTPDMMRKGRPLHEFKTPAKAPLKVPPDATTKTVTETPSAGGDQTRVLKLQS